MNVCLSGNRGPPRLFGAGKALSLKGCGGGCRGSGGRHCLPCRLVLKAGACAGTGPSHMAGPCAPEPALAGPIPAPSPPAGLDDGEHLDANGCDLARLCDGSVASGCGMIDGM